MNISHQNPIVNYALEMNSIAFSINSIVDVLRKDSLNKDIIGTEDEEVGYETLSPCDIEALHIAIKMLVDSAYVKGLKVIEHEAPSLNQEIISL